MEYKTSEKQRAYVRAYQKTERGRKAHNAAQARWYMKKYNSDPEFREKELARNREYEKRRRARKQHANDDRP